MGTTLAGMGRGGWLSFEPFASISLYNRVELKRTRTPPSHLLWWFKNNGCISNHSTTRLRPDCRANGDAEETESNNNRVEEDWVSSPSASPYQILGVNPISCSPSHLKAAFRARVKEFHPDVCKDIKGADAIIQRVIHAYKDTIVYGSLDAKRMDFGKERTVVILSKRHHLEATEGACLDPFEEPECEAYDLFIDEVLCVGKGCPYSCVKRAPHAFSFTSENGTARAISQGHGDDYQVQLAVGQCPRRCIHYVTPSQRTVLEDLLDSVLNDPYNMGDAALLESLISKAMFQNNRFHKPKQQPKVSTEYVDWS